MYCFKSLLRKKKEKIVVLLGAGAAIPWGGVTTAGLRDILIRDKHFGEIDSKTVGKYLFDILDSFYGHTNTNFEEFIAVLEELMNYVFDNTNTPSTHYMPAVFDLRGVINTLLSSKAEELFAEDGDEIEVKQRRFVYELYRHYVNLVIREIEKYNNQILEDKHSELNTNLLAFTKYFLNRGYAVKFYTTNYDNLIPQVFNGHIKIYEGLSTSNLPSIARHWDFNYNLNRFKMACASHFNIHGSIFLKKLWDNQAIKYKTLYDEFPQDMPNFASITHGNPNEALFFAPITTGFKKTQRMVTEPFNLGFSALTNDLNDCRALITVGCSFSDPHINSMLSSFTSWNKAKFINVAKMDRTFNCSNNSEDFRLHDSVTEISSKKECSTWLHDTTGRKFIYKKGFADFLQDSSNWKIILP